jgi:hypothetical protein
LVEAAKAAMMKDMIILLKGGSCEIILDELGESFVFRANMDMLYKLMLLVDITQAEATVESDRDRILMDIDVGLGIDQLNKMLRGTLAGAYSACKIPGMAVVQCAMCGDAAAMDRVLLPSNVDASILAAAAGGYLTLLRQLLTAGADRNARDGDARTPVMLATYGG